jgi:hypothetical protein
MKARHMLILGVGVAWLMLAGCVVYLLASVQLVGASSCSGF